MCFIIRSLCRLCPIHNSFNIHVTLPIPAVILKYVIVYHKMSLIKVVWYVLRVKKLLSWSPTEPSGPWGEEKLGLARRSWVMYTRTHFSISWPPPVLLSSSCVHILLGYILVLHKFKSLLWQSRSIRRSKSVNFKGWYYAKYLYTFLSL